jgi:hypothetical protein
VLDVGIRLVILFILFSLAKISWALDYRLGGQIGYGDSGISTMENIGGAQLEVSRSNGPGMMGFFAELLVTDQTAVSLHHRRGFTLAPFDAGLGFTEIGWKWFHNNPAPSMIDSQDGSSTVMFKKTIWWYGIGGGVAEGKITRSGDAVPSISGTGVFMSFHGGADIQIQPRVVTRYELVFSETAPSTGLKETTLSELGLMWGLYYMY